MFQGLILKVTKFQLPTPKHFSTVVQIILEGHYAPPPPSCQIGLRCFFSKKATFKIIFEQNCEKTTAKKPETRPKVDFLFERANILSKSQLVTLAEKLRKNQLFETNLDIN